VIAVPTPPLLSRRGRGNLGVEGVDPRRRQRAPRIPGFESPHLHWGAKLNSDRRENRGGLRPASPTGDDNGTETNLALQRM